MIEISDVMKAINKAHEGSQLAADAVELYKTNHKAALYMAESALRELQRANEMASYLPSYEQSRLVSTVSGPPAVFLRELFGL